MLPATQKAIQQIRNYFIEHQPLFKQEKQFLCCTDILESTFGRYKNKGGFKAITDDVLTIALYGKIIKLDNTKQALTATTQTHVQKWKKMNVCSNRFSQLLRLRKQAKKAA